ncbi:hypothetical protein ACFW04_014563 [Cataglyphis niger]
MDEVASPPAPVEQTHVGRRIVEAVAPLLSEQTERSKGISYQMTQVHGCFGKYLHEIGKEGSTSYHHCEIEKNTMKHTLDSCPAWECERDALKKIVGFDFSLPAVVAAMLEGEVKWRAVASFCETVMSRKEITEREREGGGRDVDLIPVRPRSR